MIKSHFIMINAVIIFVVIASGCTDPTKPPVLISLIPNPANPHSVPQNLDFLGSNMDTAVYFILDTGTEKITLEPENVPGRWTFRCIFGFHYIYTFDALDEFVYSLSSPAEITIQAFNVGPNLLNENGGGDDLGSMPKTWMINLQ